MEKVSELRGEKVDIDDLLEGWRRFQEIQERVQKLGAKKEMLGNLVKLKKTEKQKVEDKVITEIKSIAKQLKELKQSTWDLEEGSLLDLLNLQNCDSDSTFEENIIFEKVKPPKSLKNSLLP